MAARVKTIVDQKLDIGLFASDTTVGPFDEENSKCLAFATALGFSMGDANPNRNRMVGSRRCDLASWRLLLLIWCDWTCFC